MVIIGASFDSVADQREFAEEQSFPYRLLSDPDRSAARSYDAVRQPGEKFAEYGIPRRVSYLIDPEGRIARAYDVEGDGKDLASHAAELLADVTAATSG